MDSPQRRSYDQYCGVARALDVIGERWTLLIVRNLLLGPRRYSDLLRELPGITTNLLAKRLKEMEAIDIVAREERPAPNASTVYALTESGLRLEPVVMEIGRWGGRFMGKPKRTDNLDIAWALLSLKRRYRGGLDTVLGLSIDGRSFELSFTPDYMAVQERPAIRPDAIIGGTTATFRDIIFEGAKATELRKEGRLAIEGTEASVREVFRALEAFHW